MTKRTPAEVLDEAYDNLVLNNKNLLNAHLQAHRDMQALEAAAQRELSEARKNYMLARYHYEEAIDQLAYVRAAIKVRTLERK